MEDLYATLGITFEATHADVERAYRQRITPFLQSRRPTPEEAQGAMMIEEAHAVLSDPSRRVLYDEQYQKEFGAGGTALPASPFQPVSASPVAPAKPPSSGVRPAPPAKPLSSGAAIPRPTPSTAAPQSISQSIPLPSPPRPPTPRPVAEEPRSAAPAAPRPGVPATPRPAVSAPPVFAPIARPPAATPVPTPRPQAAAPPPPVPEAEESPQEPPGKSEDQLEPAEIATDSAAETESDEEYKKVAAWFGTLVAHFNARRFEETVEVAAKINRSSYGSAKANVLEALAYHKLRKPARAREAILAAVGSTGDWRSAGQAVRDLVDGRSGDEYLRLLDRWKKEIPAVGSLKIATWGLFAAAAPFIAAVVLCVMRQPLPGTIAFAIGAVMVGGALSILHRGQPHLTIKRVLLAGALPLFVFVAVLIGMRVTREVILPDIASLTGFDAREQEEATEVSDALVVGAFKQVEEYGRPEAAAPVVSAAPMRLERGAGSYLENRNEEISPPVKRLARTRKVWRIFFQDGHTLDAPEEPAPAGRGKIHVKQANGRTVQYSLSDIARISMISIPVE